MPSLFQWNDTFLTHIDSVDEQHQRLVGLINQLGEMVMSGKDIDLQSFASVRDGILNYAIVHFGDEEALIRTAGLDPRYLQRQYSDHKAYIHEATLLGDKENTLSIEKIMGLENFLVHWLVRHILEVDHSMVRQIHAMREGKTPTEAFELENGLKNSSTEPLLSAMNGLFLVVSERNRELYTLNRGLEQRVEQRTMELEQANRKLQLQSTHDDLTGLPNRRFAMLSLDQLWKERQRYGEPLSLLLLDADHFKQVNDRFGHAKGDELLRIVAERLRQSVRASDIVHRLGGDEFLVICPRSDREGATVVASKILAESKPLQTTEGVECWDGSLSIGIAECNSTMDQYEDLLKAADQAMYLAKSKGGGCVV